MNSDFSFFKTSCLTKAEELSLLYYLPIAGGRIIGFIPFPRVLVLWEMQSVSSRIFFISSWFSCVLLVVNIRHLPLMYVLLVQCIWWTRHAKHCDLFATSKCVELSLRSHHSHCLVVRALKLMADNKDLRSTVPIVWGIYPGQQFVYNVLNQNGLCSGNMWLDI